MKVKVVSSRALGQQRAATNLKSGVIRMIFKTVRRFGRLLAGARAGWWWKWLIASLVASLVSVPAAAAATRVERVPAAGAGPVARTAAVPVLATTIVTNLAAGAISKAGSLGFGWVLSQFGLEDGMQTEIAGVRDQLRQINTTLDEIVVATAQLRAELAQGTYSGLVAQASTITASIKTGMQDLDTIANLPAADRTKRSLTEARLTFIDENLIKKPAQVELATRISGEAGADGLIVAASKVAKTRSCCWTARTSEQVRTVFAYYQAEEAQLLLLRVEYMHAHPDTYSGATIETNIKQVETELKAQDALLKPSPPCCVYATYDGARLPLDIVNPLIAEPGTNLIWNTAYLGAQMPATYSLFTQRALEAEGWRVATAAQVHKLISGWNGKNWAEWLDRQVEGQIGSLKYVFEGPSGPRPFQGVWTYTTTLCATCSSPGPIDYNGIDASGAEQRGTLGGTFLAARKGVLLVKDRSENYWW